MKHKRKPAADWPTFDAPLLRDITSAFLRRHKGIAYKAPFSCEREFSETAEGVTERLNLDWWRGHLRLSIWADGLLWLLVCISGPGRRGGWSFMDNFHGEVLDVSAEALVGMIEATLELSFGTDPSAERAQLREVWKRVKP